MRGLWSDLVFVLRLLALMAAVWGGVFLLVWFAMGGIHV
jgi:hypothetical protein